MNLMFSTYLDHLVTNRGDHINSRFLFKIKALSDEFYALKPAPELLRTPEASKENMSLVENV